jgi:hypothetical protein
MRCPKCVSAGLRSTVAVGISTSTCIASSAYYDEDGRYHLDDPNTTTTGYSCSQGHNWHVSERQGIPPQVVYENFTIHRVSEDTQ